MKKLLILAILSIGLSVNAQSSSTNGSFWSVTNLLAKFRYNGAGAYTNTITFSNTVNLASSNAFFTLTFYSNQFQLFDNAGHTYFYGTNGFVGFERIGASTINATSLSVVGAITNNGAPGKTVDTLVSAPNSKTNLMQFSNGILTNIVNSY